MKNGSVQKHQYNSDKSKSDGISLAAILELVPGDKVISFHYQD
jgi:hypothetical protein